MPLTPQEVYDNLVAHDCCAEGYVWCKNKDSDQIWNINDPNIADGLFWWAAKNAGGPGWPTQVQLGIVLEQIAEVTYKYLGQMQDHVRDNRISNPIQQLNRFKREVIWEDQTRLQEYLTEILPIVKKLRYKDEPTI